jgi:hypothetical protein
MAMSAAGISYSMLVPWWGLIETPIDAPMSWLWP